MTISSIEVVPKGESSHSNYSGTDKWQKTETVIQLTVKNGNTEVTDELPGGAVKQIIAAHKKKIASNKPPLLVNGRVNSVLVTPMTPSASETSIASQQSFEGNHNAQQKPEKSLIPIRSHSSVSSSNRLGLRSYSDLFQPSRILAQKNKGKGALLEPRVYEINEKTREALLSANHPFLERISKDKIHEAVSFRMEDKVRVKNLTDEDITELRKYEMKAKIFKR